MIKKYLYFILIPFLFSCDSLPDDPTKVSNPLDPDDQNYVDPQVNIILGPVENDIVNSDEVNFTWEGNRDDMQFRYRMDSESWTDYTNATAANFDLLDDEDHLFSVQGRYLSGTESDIEAVNFTVDAIAPKAIFLYPRRAFTSAGGNIDIDLYVEVDDSIAITSIIINYDQSDLQAQSVTFYETTTNNILLKNGGELISFSDIDNDNGTIQIDCAVYNGNPRDVIGIGRIAKLTFIDLAGTLTNIQISNQSLFRNSRNENVNIHYFIGSEVVIE